MVPVLGALGAGHLASLLCDEHHILRKLQLFDTKSDSGRGDIAGPDMMIQRNVFLLLRIPHNTVICRGSEYDLADAACQLRRDGGTRQGVSGGNGSAHTLMIGLTCATEYPLSNTLSLARMPNALI
ncbi:hypothetical protein E2C01_061076 [Portunus trituberculatus]|uniref:Uncharacterized protein n=1 Tax=Portunus trituberculatus TaxID=210409 RepID=A0A5B7H495_PORTR|nr:hypothetical protein [Portunus trituberculatus]